MRADRYYSGMRALSPHVKWLFLGGMFTWLCAGIPLALTAFDENPTVDSMELTAWAVAYALFAVAYWWLIRHLHPLSQQKAKLGLATMVITCLVVTFSSQTASGGIFLLIIGGIAPWVFSSVQGALFVVSVNILLAAIFFWLPALATKQAWTFSIIYLGYSSFAFVMSDIARRTMGARDEARRVNSELRATQTLLADSTRMAERLRISRELHDLIGHHLTALSLNLEVASHLSKGKVKEHVTQAHTVARLLLSDVREVVGAMRSRDAIDVAPALRELAIGVPQPEIHLHIPDNVRIEDPRLAQVILRCVQEAITNTMKHANAKNLTIALRFGKDRLELRAEDDGKGMSSLSKGHGLTGMTERVRQFGGDMTIDTSTGGGFAINAWFPLEQIT